MRPIDADRLKYSISLTMDIMEKTEDDVETLAVLKAMAEAFLEVIDGMPTLSTSVLFTHGMLDMVEKLEDGKHE